MMLIVRSFFTLFLAMLLINMGSGVHKAAPHKTTSKDSVRKKAEVAPQYKGGPAALKAYLKNNLRYNEDLKKRAGGKVVLKFTVTNKGLVQNVKLASSSLYQLKNGNKRPIRNTDSMILVREAIRVVQSMPAWTPGKSKGKAVTSSHTLPIVFTPINPYKKPVLIRSEDNVEVMEAPMDYYTEKTTGRDVQSDRGTAGTGEYMGTGEGSIGADDNSDRTLVYAEQMPVFPGGDAALREFLNDHIIYPSHLREQGIEGKVVARFTVTQTGEIEQITIIRKVHPDMDNELIRVLRTMPPWTPGRQNGRNVSVFYSLPFQFRLDR